MTQSPKRKGRFAYDALWGTGRGYLDKILRDYGLEVETIHDWRDVTFGGKSPEPSEKQVGELVETVKSKGLTLGLATDGDGDRFGIIDSNGDFIQPNHLIAILTDYLAESRGWTLGVARSVATSHLIDRVAKERGLKLYETPVGFKFIGELINKDRDYPWRRRIGRSFDTAGITPKKTESSRVCWQSKPSRSEEKV